MAYLSICDSHEIMGQSFGIIMSLLAVGDATRELSGPVLLLHRSPGM